MQGMELYTLNGREFWAHPEDAPKGAEKVKPKVRAKAKTVQNKAKTAETKEK